VTKYRDAMLCDAGAGIGYLVVGFIYRRVQFEIAVKFYSDINHSKITLKGYSHRNSNLKMNIEYTLIPSYMIASMGSLSDMLIPSKHCSDIVIHMKHSSSPPLPL